jgi:hypothetical protein
MRVRSQSVPSSVPSLFSVSVHKNGRQSALFPLFCVFEAVSPVGSESIHITLYQRGTEGTVGTRRGVNHLPAKIGWERPWNNTEHETRISTADARPPWLPPSYFCAIGFRCHAQGIPKRSNTTLHGPFDLS